MWFHVNVFALYQESYDQLRLFAFSSTKQAPNTAFFNSTCSLFNRLLPLTYTEALAAEVASMHCGGATMWNTTQPKKADNPDKNLRVEQRRAKVELLTASSSDTTERVMCERSILPRSLTFFNLSLII